MRQWPISRIKGTTLVLSFFNHFVSSRAHTFAHDYYADYGKTKFVMLATDYIEQGENLAWCQGGTLVTDNIAVLHSV